MASVKKLKDQIKKGDELKPIKDKIIKADAVPAKIRTFRFPKYTVWVAVLVLVAVVAFFAKSIFIAALVNGKPISRISIVKNLEKSSGKNVLENLITKELISQEARKQNIVIADEDVQKEIDNLSKTVQAQGTTLDAALSAQGMTKDDLQQNIKMQKTVEKLLASQLTISEDDIKKYFDQNKTVYGKDAKYDDLKESIKKDLEQQKLSTAFETWYKKLQSESDIKYFVSY